jgi:hypothetical protein
MPQISALAGREVIEDTHLIATPGQRLNEM